jgi:RHS repeat-associated protein
VRSVQLPFLTLKERDNETGLDYFLVRYYSSVLGRFTSTDEAFIDQQEADPQSWNLYSYVRNKPMLYIDSSGRWIQVECTTGNRAGKCWQAEKNDTYQSLAEKVSWSSATLRDFFQNQSITEGRIFDTSGLKDWVIQSLADRTPNYELGVGGGLRTAGRAASGLRGAFSSAWKEIKQFFGRKGTAEGTKRTIQVVQQEGNLVEMVGKGARGEIRVRRKLRRKPML